MSLVSSDPGRSAQAEGVTWQSSRTVRRRPVAAPRVCAAPGCGGGWSRPWRSRQRPVFEGDWGCGAGCLEALIARAIRREWSGEVSPAPASAAHRHRVPLGLVLLAQGWITHPQLQAALTAQRASGEGRIGDWLRKHQVIADELIVRGLAVQWSCPVLTLDRFSPRAMALVLPRRFVSEYGMVPLRVAGSSLLYVGFAVRPNAAVSLAVEQMTGLRVESGLMRETDHSRALEALTACPAVAETTNEVRDPDGLKAAVAAILARRQPVASRMVRVHDAFWLRIWLESGAGTGAPSTPEDVEDYVFTVKA